MTIMMRSLMVFSLKMMMTADAFIAPSVVVVVPVVVTTSTTKSLSGSCCCNSNNIIFSPITTTTSLFMSTESTELPSSSVASSSVASSTDGTETSSFSSSATTTTTEGRDGSSSSSSSSSSNSKQAEYGKTVELPTTYATCGRCGTAYALTNADFNGTGRRLECTVCGHSWYQSSNRIQSLADGYEMVPLPDRDLSRIRQNIDEGKNPRFMGDFKLYVGNISFTVTEDVLYDVFSKVGTVGDVSIVRDESGRSRGFGFITMRDRTDGERAMSELVGMNLQGRNLDVRESEPKNER